MPKTSSIDELQKAVEIPAENIIYNEKTDRIGGGAFGEVYQAIIKGIQVAVKVPRKQHWSEQELQDFRNEVKIMKSIYHTNVVLFLGACLTGKILIVTEKMLCDMDTLLHTPQKLPPQLKGRKVTYLDKLKMMHDAALGICWLHDILKMVHRDLKPANFLLDENFRVKICDFGFTEHFKTTREVKMKGTALYSAPEIWQETACTFASDIYSFGLILWEVYTEEILFQEYDDLEPFCDDVIEGGLRPAIPSDAPQHYVELMTHCWDKEMEKRPTMDRVRHELEMLMVESVIQSQLGRDFWKKNFGGDPKSSKNTGFNTEIPVNEFNKAVVSNVDMLTAREMELLRPILLGGSVLVTMERFNLFTSWFGDFFDNKNCEFLMSEITSIIRAPWFFDVTKDDAELKLVGEEDGAFLIRLSTSDPVSTPFTLSRNVVSDGKSKVAHKRIARVSYDNVPRRYSTDLISDRKKNVIATKTLDEIIDELIRLHFITKPCKKVQRVEGEGYDGDY